LPVFINSDNVLLLFDNTWKETGMKKMNVLVVGSGGREHALAWKIKKSRWCGKLFVAPGNAGTAEIAENVPIGVNEIPKLIEFAKKNRIGLTVVGPEEPLKNGIVDQFQKAKRRIFGPTAQAALLETSKSFAKDFMRKASIPTAEFKVFYNYELAIEYLKKLPEKPLVIKADGLAAGKGAFVCKTKAEAEQVINDLLLKKTLKEAGETIIIEEFLEGQEVSALALCDGCSFLLLPTSQDHKHLNDGDQGPMTGGMGAIAPVPWIHLGDLEDISDTIFKPALRVMADMGTPFQGCLYAGLMMTKDGPKVLEFNVRFGDPETEVILPLVNGTDFLELLARCADGRLGSLAELPYLLANPEESAACVVLASGGYPGPYDKGLPINLGRKPDGAWTPWGGEVFHAGTAIRDGQLVTNGGRVMVATMAQPVLMKAVSRAYTLAQCVRFPGMYFRNDIGRKALDHS